MVNFLKFQITFIAMCFFVVNLNAQKDSLEVERLFKNGVENLKVNPKISQLNFIKALDTVNYYLKYKTENTFLLQKKASVLEFLSDQYRRDKDYVLSLKYIQEGLKIRKKLQDYSSLTTVYRLLGKLYLSKRDSIKSKYFFNKALEQLKKYPNDKEYVSLYNYYSGYYFTYKNNELAKSYAERALSYADSIGYKSGKAYAFNFLSSYERRIGNYQGVIEYSLKDLEISISINDKLGMERSYIDLGYANRRLNRPKKAIYYYEKSLALVKEMEINGKLANRYLSLSNAYNDLEDYETAFRFYRSYKRQQIKDLNIQSIKDFSNLEAKFNYERQRVVDSLSFVEKQKIKELRLMDEASARFWKIISLISVIFGIIILSVVTVLQRNKNKVKLSKLRNSMLEKEVDYKRKDLKQLAIDITQNKEWALVLAEKINLIKASSGKKKSSEIDRLEVEIKNKIRVDESAQDIQNKIESLSSEFYENLNKEYLNLTNNDIRLCSLIRLGMDTKQIAMLQNISPASVKVSRHRLRKKLNLSPDQDFYAFLRSL